MFRINQLAKDFGIKSKEIITKLEDVGVAGKSTMTTLDASEFNLFFDELTKANQIKNLDQYLDGKTAIKKPKSEADEEKKPDEKKAEAAAAAPKADEKKAEAPKADEKKTDEKKTEPKADEKKPDVKKEAEVQPKQPAQQKPVQQPKQDVRPQNPVQSQQPRPQGQSAGNNQNRPQSQGQGYNQNRTQSQGQGYNQSRPQSQGQGYNQNRPQSQGTGYNQSRPQSQGQGQGYNQNRPQGQNQFRDKDKGGSQSAPTPKFKPTVQPSVEKHRTGSTRIVDMRTSSVDLSKYDEKLDTFVPYSQTSDKQSNKQKLKKQNNNDVRSAKNRNKESQAMERMKKANLEKAKKMPLHITVPDEISVGELASRLKVTAAEVVKRLMMMGMMASVNQIIDYDTAYLIADELGAKVEREVVVTIEEKLFGEEQDTEEMLVERAPVVCVMGHVDHGKTSLLDAIRHTNVTSGEAGGITQAIGAYRVNIDGKDITFLDTPGHEAFTAMRARGAQSTDIAILVVAADDGIMPQTVEAISHAKAAGVSIIVAINKMDKPQANPDQVKQQLTEYELVPEEWGGDVPCIPVSALTKQGIDDLLEMITLVADMKELKANPDRAAKGTVVEARLDKGKGPIATVLVQNGTLRTGDIIVAGTTVGRVRAMTDDRGRKIQAAGPSVPVEITGLDDVPTGGDIFNVVSDERLARELVDQRRSEQKEEAFNAQTKVTLDNLFDQMQQGEIKELKVIVKADVQGSVEAVRQSLEKLSNEEVRVHVIHNGVGAVNESDVMLASASNAIIVGFNVRPDPVAEENAKRSGVDMRLYRIIYDCIEEIESAMKGMLAPKFRENLLGRAECRQVYKVSNVGTIAGSYVLDGKITRTALLRIVRDGIIIADDKIASLRRFKDDVKEVAQGYECGIGLERFNDLKEGDIFEVYIMEEYRD